MKNAKKIWRLMLSGLLYVVILTGCGSSANSTSSYYTQKADVATEEAYYESYDGLSNGSYAAESTMEFTDKDSIQQAEILSERKLIKNVNMDVETKEFDAFMGSLEAQVQGVGGYIENMNTYNGSVYSTYRDTRNASMTLRIPQNKLTEFLSTVSEICNVIRRSDSVDDVTLSYVDMASRRDALKVEQARLLELLEKAESLDDILIIEDRMTTVRYQLESMESQLRTLDNKVNYSTVYLDVREVKELTPVIVEEETVWQRIGNGFMENLSDVGNGFLEFFIWFISSLPHLVIWAVIIFVAVLVIRKLHKRNKKKREEKKNIKQEKTE